MIDCTKSCPPCPEKISSEFLTLVEKMARTWIDSDLRPEPDPIIIDEWKSLIEIWAHADNVPLLIRRSTLPRGTPIVHTTGRIIIPCDNSPAHWVLNRCFSGEVLTLENIISCLEGDNLPITLALKKKERITAKYSCTAKDLLGKRGWKLCHIEPVRLGHLRGMGGIEGAPISKLQSHFKRFMCPSNMFLMPKAYGGLGELPEMIQAVKESRT